MTLLFTSEGFYNEKIKETFRNLTAKFDNPKIAIVALGSYKKNKNHFDKVMADFFEMGYTENNIEFINLNAYAAKNLINFDVLYLDGGNPYQILSMYKNKTVDKIISKMHNSGKLIMGISGSAIVLCPTLELMNDFIPQFNKNYLNSYEALNLVDFEFFPHYGRSDELFGNSKEIDKKINDFEIRTNKKVLKLTDDEFFVVE